MIITTTELRRNLSKYLTLATTEDILITQHGEIVAKLSDPSRDRLSITESLIGILPNTMTLEEAREERCLKLMNDN